ncbi:ABC transporter permease [Skermanella stibiiresistens SB22]|uniref:ABC transporter permease n=1 Tax=Skermanella stibiiresistens SB22 TaxID=1385369 RepID=W9HAX3_9PROT|nr:ABC transporter permease [Skermanella stibiiresistens]EWY41891.1 ABC transporter permease [Skermanella stibiiresistens SB22]
MRNAIYPALTAVILVGAWYLAVLFFEVPRYLLPLPGEVVTRLIEDRDFLLRHGWVTTYETLGGFALSIVIGIPLALLIVSSSTIDRALMPWIVLSQTFPKIALAPLIVVWFGLGLVPKLIVTFLVAFFPILISTIVGLRSMERDMDELRLSMRASVWQTFWYFRLPLALPSLFAGLKVSVAFAAVGAVIAEWVGANEGLGYLLLTANANLDTPLLFAVLVLLMVLGMVLYHAIEMLERLLIPWHATIRLKTGQPSF